MKIFKTYALVVLFASSFAIACTNPSHPDKTVKGTSKMDEGDTTKKQKDSVQPAKRVNPEDSVRKY